MMKRIVVALSLALIVAPAVAADFSIGLRWNYIHMFNDGDFWENYVEDKWVDEWDWRSDAWDPTAAQANSGLVDDYNGLNALPGVKVSMRFGNIKVDAIDAEYYSRERQISNYLYNSSQTGWSSTHDNERLYLKNIEDMELITFQFKHSINYVIEYNDFDYYVGAGFNWTMWETTNTLCRYDYTVLNDESFYPPETMTDNQDGIAFGFHLQAGAEYALTENFSPFVGFTYLMAEDEWENPTEFDMYWSHMTDDITDFQFATPRKDKYDLTFDGLRIDFGVVYHI